MKDKCRWCKHYMPDDRYNGCVGWCNVKDKPMSYDHECADAEQGTQHWLSGKEVKE
jgi:hypothetical protein